MPFSLFSLDIRGHEQRALNYLVNEYLLQRGNKLTSITFSEENGDQDFEDWEAVVAVDGGDGGGGDGGGGGFAAVTGGSGRARPPSLLRLFRDYGRHVAPKKVQMKNSGN